METIYVHPSTEIVYTDTPLQTLETKVIHQGMTLRDYFAGLALQGFVSNRQYSEMFSGNNGFPIPDFIAKTAYEIADAMLKIRSLETKQ